MILKSYDDYKDSESKWLGEIPKHWNVQQLKSVIVNWRNGKWGNDPIENAPDNYVCVRVADFNRTKGLIDDKKLTYRNYKDENISDCLIRPNHILIERSGGGDNQLVGSTVLYRLNYPAVCSNFISILEIDESKVDVDFLQYAFTHLYFLNLNKLAIKQTSGIQNLDLKQYIQNNFALPSKSEQIQVVDFLHKETSHIDTLISKQEQLIKLLEEQRKSIISHAVTKGLNPNAAMKDSGVEWLGKIPEHWEVLRFSTIFTENKRKNIGMIENNVLSLSYGNIKEKSIETNKGLLPESFETYQIVEPNDIIFRFTDLQNDKKSLRNGISKFHGIITSAYVNVKTDENSDFYNYLFRSYDLKKVFYSMGDGMRQSLKMSELNLMPIVLPPKHEQQAIVNYIELESKKIMTLISKQTHLIEKLKEYRSSIISHAVTGKIDVREAL